MIKFNPEQLQIKKFYIWVGTTIILLVVGIFIINSQVATLAQTIQDKNSQTQALKNREENISKLQEDYQIIKDNISTVTAVLPDEKNVALFVKYLEDLSNKTQTNVDLIFDDKFNALVEQNRYLVFNISVSGSSDGVYDFWKNLEKGPYYIKITSFDFDTTNGLGSDSQIRMTAKVFTNVPYQTK